MPAIAAQLALLTRYRVGRPAVNDICNVIGCDRNAKARGLCGSHYTAWRREQGFGNRVPVPRCEDGLPHAWANGWCRLCGCDKPRERWTTKEGA